MADLSKIKLNGTTYNFKDAEARENFNNYYDINSIDDNYYTNSEIDDMFENFIVSIDNIPVATTSANGLMPATDKAILDNLNPNVSTTLSDINASEFGIINAKQDNILDLVIAAEPVIESQIRTSNLLDVNTTFGNAYINASGVATNSAPDLLGGFIPVTPGQDIYYTGHVGETNASSVNRRLHVYTANQTWIKQISFAGSLRVGQDWSTHGTVPSNGAYVRVSWGVTDTNVMISVGAPAYYQPYYITPFDVITSVSFKIGATTNPEDATEYTFNVPASIGDQYGFTFNPVAGTLQQVTGHIASYNGETLPGHWLSDRDTYAEGTTPSIGAEVIYRLNDEDIVEYDCENGMNIPLNLRENYFFMENGTFQEISYYAETLAVQHLTIYNGATFGNINILESDIQSWNDARDAIGTKADIDSPIFTGRPTVASAPGRSDVSLRVASAGFTQTLFNNIAPVEMSNKATRNYDVGDYIYVTGYLYKVTAAIANGASLVAGTNMVATTVMDEIKALQSAIS